ncbi:unnamed protein product [Victoria cruziana]
MKLWMKTLGTKDAHPTR